MDKPQAFAAALVHQIRRFRYVLISALGVALVLILYNAPNLKIDNSIRSWYSTSDPALAAYESFIQTYGNDDVILCGVQGEQSFAHPDRIRSTVALNKQLNELEGVAFVSSYVQFPYRFLSDDYRSLEQLVLAKDSLPTQESIQAWMAENPFKERLIGTSPEFVLFYVWPDTTAYVSQHRQQILNEIDTILGTSGDLSKGGIGVVYNGINEATLNEGWTFLVLSYFILILAVLLVTGSYFITGLAFLTITGGTISLLGFMLLLGKSINIVTLALPPLIMVIGVSNFIHFTLHTRAKLTPNEKRTALILPVVAFVAVPVTFNMLTTAGGFFSITTSSIQITRDYGLLAGLCILSVSLLSILGTIFFHKRLLEQDLLFHGMARINEAVSRLMAWAERQYRAVIMVAFIFTGLLILGIKFINVDTVPLNFIPENHSIRADHQTLEQQVGPYVPLEFVVYFEKGSWKQKANFKRLADAQALIAEDEAVNATLSVSDFALYAYRNTPGGNLPDSFEADQISQRKLGILSSNLWQDPFIQRLSTRRGEQVRIISTIPLTSAREFRNIHQRISTNINTAFEGELSIQPSGYIPLYSNIVDTVLKDQIISLSIAVLVILLLIYISLQSWRFTLLALPCNLIPVALVLGAMGYLKIPLDIASVTLAATILGIIVDDSLHLLFSAKAALQKGISVDMAIKTIARQSGTAVLNTSLVLILGYGVIALSTVPILSITGKLMVLAIFAALAADLILLPALLKFFFSKK